MSAKLTNVVHADAMRPASPKETSTEPHGLNINRYSNKKTLAKGLLDMAMIANNAVQLKTVVRQGSVHPFYTLLLVLIPISLTLQMVCAFLLIIDGTTDINEVKKQRRADLLNNVVTGLITVICVLNVMISSFFGEYMC
ncbi:Uncharacterised protein g8095 [Pycnogonum litorale]